MPYNLHHVEQQQRHHARVCSRVYFYFIQCKFKQTHGSSSQHYLSVCYSVDNRQILSIRMKSYRRIYRNTKRHKNLTAGRCNSHAHFDVLTFHLPLWL